MHISHIVKRTVLAALAALTLALASNVSAQRVGTATLIGADTNCVAASATNSYTLVCSEYESLALQFNTQATAADTGTYQLTAYRSIDSTTYETSPFFSQVITNNGTAPVVTVIPLSVEGAAVLKFTIGNTDAVAITNCGTSMAVVRFKAPKLSVFSTTR